MRGFVAGVALVVAALAFIGAAPRAEEEDVRCHGRRAEIVGTDGKDVLRGTRERDVIYGGAGDDEIFGSLGNDLLCGGLGDDLVHGGRGNDEVDGGAGTDRAIGDLGDDKVMGGTGDADEAAGSLGIDMVSGGPGDFDLVHGDYGYDRMDGGPGAGDIASFATKVAGGKGSGVWVSLRQHKARGDGHDRLFRLDDVEGSAFRDELVGSKSANHLNGGPGDDTLRGGGGADELIGGQGSDACFPGGLSCGREAPPKASAYVQLDRAKGGGGGLQIVGGGGPDEFTVAFDEASQSFGVSAAKGVAIGPGCVRAGTDPKQISCAAEGPARWVMVDLGPGDDGFRVEGSLETTSNVRIAGGLGDDTIRGGPEDDLLESGPGADHLYGGDGADGLVGGLPGPTFLYGEGDGDLLAAGGGCAGGAIVGGEGRDDASFAETQAHPGLLYISFPKNKAWIDTLFREGRCNPVRLDDSNEDMEGSFDWDVLIGDSGPNALLGQPGEDELYGNGGEDIIDARDGVRDFVIQCGRGTYVQPPRKPREKGPLPEPILQGTPEGRALTDSFDPAPALCADVVVGEPVAGLNNGG